MPCALNPSLREECWVHLTNHPPCRGVMSSLVNHEFLDGAPSAVPVNPSCLFCLLHPNGTVCWNPSRYHLTHFFHVWVFQNSCGCPCLDRCAIGNGEPCHDHGLWHGHHYGHGPCRDHDPCLGHGPCPFLHGPCRDPCPCHGTCPCHGPWICPGCGHDHGHDHDRGHGLDHDHRDPWILSDLVLRVWILSDDDHGYGVHGFSADHLYLCLCLCGLCHPLSGLYHLGRGLYHPLCGLDLASDSQSHRQVHGPSGLPSLPSLLSFSQPLPPPFPSSPCRTSQ